MEKNIIEINSSKIYINGISLVNLSIDVSVIRKNIVGSIC